MENWQGPREPWRYNVEEWGGHSGKTCVSQPALSYLLPHSARGRTQFNPCLYV